MVSSWTSHAVYFIQRLWESNAGKDLCKVEIHGEYFLVLGTLIWLLSGIASFSNSSWNVAHAESGHGYLLRRLSETAVSVLRFTYNY